MWLNVLSGYTRSDTNTDTDFMSISYFNSQCMILIYLSVMLCFVRVYIDENIFSRIMLQQSFVYNMFNGTLLCTETSVLSWCDFGISDSFEIHTSEEMSVRSPVISSWVLGWPLRRVTPSKPKFYTRPLRPSGWTRPKLSHREYSWWPVTACLVSLRRKERLNVLGVSCNKRSIEK